MYDKEKVGKIHKITSIYFRYFAIVKRKRLKCYILRTTNQGLSVMQRGKKPPCPKQVCKLRKLPKQVCPEPPVFMSIYKFAEPFPVSQSFTQN